MNKDIIQRINFYIGPETVSDKKISKMKKPVNLMHLHKCQEGRSVGL
jgi:hypothetical protein